MPPHRQQRMMRTRKQNLATAEPGVTHRCDFPTRRAAKKLRLIRRYLQRAAERRRTLRELEVLMSEKYQRSEIHVTVTFPLAGQPFRGPFSATTTVGQVRAAAMTQFAAHEDQASVFYLTHNGDRLADSVTLATIADHANGLKLRLVKDLIQG